MFFSIARSMPESGMPIHQEKDWMGIGTRMGSQQKLRKGKPEFVEAGVRQLQWRVEEDRSVRGD